MVLKYNVNVNEGSIENEGGEKNQTHRGNQLINYIYIFLRGKCLN